MAQETPYTFTNGLVNMEEGHISREIFVNETIYRQEQEQVFTRAWLFVGHESQIPQPGDYFNSCMGEESVILCRDRAGKIHVFLNSCRHRGMRVCRADKDNVSYLRCVYHGWTYDREGGLVSAFAEDLYDPGRLKKEELGLIPVAKLAVYRGLIFATWNEDAPPFEEYLGDMSFYLDLFLGRTDVGTEVVGAPQIWDVATDWKFAADNFTGDNFHLYTAHGSVVDLGMLPPDPMSLSYGYLVRAQGGHGGLRGRALVELLGVRPVGALDAAVELVRLGRQDVEGDATLCAGGLEAGHELAAAVHADGTDPEGHARRERLEHARRGGRGGWRSPVRSPRRGRSPSPASPGNPRRPP